MVDSNEHFRPGDQAPSAPGRYVDLADVSSVEMLPGLEFKPVLAENTMLNFVSFEPNTRAPRHAHDEEQIVLVLEGEMQFELDGEVRTMRAGDVAVVPPWVPHAAWTDDTTCREVDVFNPPRQSLVEQARAQSAAASGGLGNQRDQP